MDVYVDGEKADVFVSWPLSKSRTWPRNYQTDVFNNYIVYMCDLLCTLHVYKHMFVCLQVYTLQQCSVHSLSLEFEHFCY